MTSGRLSLALVVAALLIFAIIAPRFAKAEIDVVKLTDGVKTIAAPGTPGTLAVWSETAAVLAVGKSGELRVPVVAAGEAGRGRIVAFTHTSHLDASSLQVGEHRGLLENVARWAAGVGDGKAPRVGLLNCNLGEFFKEIGFEVVDLGKPWHSQPLSNRIDVLCVVGNALNEEQSREIQRFIVGGGGVLAAQTAWAWNAKAGQTLLDNPLNRLAATAGIAWTGEYAGKNSSGTFDVAADVDLLNASKAVDALEGADTARLGREQLRQAGATATAAARLLPANDRMLRPRLTDLLKEHADTFSPSPKHPIRQDQPLERLLLAFQLAELESLPAVQVKAHPSAATFPGDAPADTPRLRRDVEIDASVPDWHSTGLYALPGEVIEVEAPSGAVQLGLKVRIGCHKDQLWHLEAWKRAPDITIEKPILGVKTRIASAFGGPVYVVVPDRAESVKLSVHISGAIAAPLFVLGKTSVDEWKQMLRSRPAPWAELATSKVILSVPSESIRGLDNPEELLQLWDRVLDAAADLAAIPRERRRPERYVPDVQISAGYMHSGYPIMTHLDAVEDMTNAAELSKGSWGLFHELGHNHQAREWTFGGTGEVTCNLFSLYVCETVCGLPMSTGHDALTKRDETVGKYLARGANFDHWKSEPFTALMMYVQLREAFGWETYKKVFAEYRGLADADRPKSDEAERDQWMVRFSRAAGRNLGPFFEAWGVPTSKAARDSIANLPDWMPDGFPPN